MANKNLFEKLVSEYKPTEKQDRFKTVSFRWHEITMWKYYLTKLSFKSQIVHHAMKADWRYFKDAAVDTIIPTSYGFFAYEAVLGKFLNTKKQRFHRLSTVEKQFEKLVGKPGKTDYSVHISYTGTLDHLTREKKRMRMLQRGKEIEVQTTHISLG